MEKHWKKVKGYEGLYEVSNYGEVKSLNYRCTGKEKILKFSKDSDGYLYLNLSKNGVRKTFRVNRLVYMTFVGEIPEDIQVNHIDEDKENNCVWNLNLMTPKENNNWGTRNARISAARRGKPNPKVADALRGKKRSEETRKKIGDVHRGKYNTKKSKAVQALNPKTLEVVMEFPSTKEAERHGFGDHRHISDCCLGKRKTHKGFIWRFC